MKIFCSLICHFVKAVKKYSSVMQQHKQILYHRNFNVLHSVQLFTFLPLSEHEKHNYIYRAQARETN